nr:outer membrane beta-barrel protein [Roseobacter litoralis]
MNDRETYQFTVTFDYEFAENWTARAGYRYLNVDNDDDDFQLEQTGPVLGVSYRF